MKSKVLKIALGLCLLIGAGYAAELLWAQAPTGSQSTWAITGKVAISATDKTLTEYCNSSQSFLFDGYVAFDPANAGAANVIKATISGASDVTAAAGTVKEWKGVQSDSVIISGTATDYINIVGKAM